MPSKRKVRRSDLWLLGEGGDVADPNAHGSRHGRGAEDSIPWSQVSRYRKALATGVGIGVSGSPATIVELAVSSGYYNLLPLVVKATPSGLATDESATIHVIAVLDNGTEVEVATRTTAAGSTSTEVFTPTDLDYSLIGDGRQVRRIRVTAESSATSTAATMDAEVEALEF